MWSEYRVVNDEDRKVWRNLATRNDNLIPVNLVLRHKVSIHKGYEEYGTPHQSVDQTLTQTYAYVFEYMCQLHSCKNKDFRLITKTNEVLINNKAFLFN